MKESIGLRDYSSELGTTLVLGHGMVSSLQRSLDTLQYYTGTQNGVLITEVT